MLLNPYRFGSPPSALLTGLVSYWKLNEASGSALDSHDVNHLTDINTVGSAAGKMGTARDFERDTAEYFTRTSGASLSTGDIDFTLACWVKPETLNNMGMMSKWSGANEYVLFFDGSKFQFLVYNGTANINVLSTAVVSAGAWYHVACWNDSANNLMGISVNGGVPVTVVNTLGARATPADPFTIGAYTAGSSMWDGLIEGAGFWKRMLLPAERAQLYNSGNGLQYPFTGYVQPLPTDPHTYWRINSIVLPVGGTAIQISELRVFSGVTDVTTTAAKTASDAVSSGSFVNLFDGSLSNYGFWAKAVVEAAGFSIVFNFATGVKIDGVKQGGFDTANRYMQAFTLQYSDDGSVWATVGTKSGLTYPGNNTLSALYTFP